MKRIIQENSIIFSIPTIPILNQVNSYDLLKGLNDSIENKLKILEERKQQKDDIQEALDGVRALPNYRKQSLEIQNQLKDADDKILETCQKIQDGVNENHRILNERLDRLEDRERNALREKILHMHRMFTSVKRNPMQAWSEMERDSFNELIKDYESLNGNGHVHTVVIPDMNKLRVSLMTDSEELAELFHSREA